MKRSRGLRPSVHLAAAILAAGPWALVTMRPVDGEPPPGRAAEQPGGASTSAAEPRELDGEAQAIRDEQYRIGEQLVRTFPDDFDAWRVLGFVYSSLGQHDQMLRCWQRCAQLKPDSADVYRQMGRHALQTEQYPQALEYFQKAVRLAPQWADLYQDRATALMSLGQLDQAIEALKRALDLAPESSEAQYLLGEAYYQSGDLARAKSAFQQAVALEPNHRPARYGLVKVCTQLGAHEESQEHARVFQRLEQAAVQADQQARQAYDDLKAMRQRLAATCVDAGRVYHRHGDGAAARKMWLRAADVDRQAPEPRRLLAQSAQREGNLAAARTWYQELIRCQPDRADHYQQLGFLHARAGDWKAAETALKKAIELAPQDASGYRALAKLYLNTRQRQDEALALATQAVQRQPVAESYFVLGWAQAQLGHLDQAQQSLQKALRLDPDNRTYRQLYDAVSASE